MKCQKEDNLSPDETIFYICISIYISQGIYVLPVLLGAERIIPDLAMAKGIHGYHVRMRFGIKFKAYSNSPEH